MFYRIKRHNLKQSCKNAKQQMLLGHWDKNTKQLKAFFMPLFGEYRTAVKEGCRCRVTCRKEAASWIQTWAIRFKG